MDTKHFFLGLALLFVWNTSAQNTAKEWTYEDKKNYATRNADSTTLNMKMLKNDLSTKNTWPTKPAISNYPSPVKKYDWGYCMLGNLTLEMEGKTLYGKSIANAKDAFRVLKDTSDFYKVAFNILYLTDIDDVDKGSAAHVASRNYPHYFSSGTQKTTQGEIDWVQMDLADSSNFAIINQRYFDLQFGQTIVVVPQKDGSLRFLQLDIAMDSFSRSPFDETGKKKNEAFYAKLRAHKALADLLNHKNTIEQPSKK